LSDSTSSQQNSICVPRHPRRDRIRVPCHSQKSNRLANTEQQIRAKPMWSSLNQKDQSNNLGDPDSYQRQESNRQNKQGMLAMMLLRKTRIEFRCQPQMRPAVLGESRLSWAWTVDLRHLAADHCGST
jgi:hypothetical protein